MELFQIKQVIFFWKFSFHLISNHGIYTIFFFLLPFNVYATMMTAIMKAKWDHKCYVMLTSTQCEVDFCCTTRAGNKLIYQFVHSLSLPYTLRHLLPLHNFFHFVAHFLLVLACCWMWRTTIPINVNENVWTRNK